ncbi:hypothetical protein MLD38_017065 [Melastoma candidum]|uniref:Uncharacterized protein n=1 Tax=Melastoma candidum TaxID=119954 RepID=A0ACB9QRB5_9MYRT|nr:hypothetical protein MLD38_017065 [Melastoma candidum]
MEDVSIDGSLCPGGCSLALRSGSGGNRHPAATNVVLMQDGAVAPTIYPVKKENKTPFKKLAEGFASVKLPEESADWNKFSGGSGSTVSITVVGASGDLAKKKIFPALFALYYEDCLPEHFTIFGYARTKMTNEELRYDSQENFAELEKKLRQHEAGRVSNRLFYLSIPPNIFIEAVKCASSSASAANGWARVIVEKPFGRDSESSAALTKSLKVYLEEDQIFRIDHYLGKELWRTYLRTWRVLRPLRHNPRHHAKPPASNPCLFAMETPVSLDAEDIRNEKVKVLRSMRPLQLDDVIVGQYKSHTKGGTTYPGYPDDKTVLSGSLTTTFAAAALFIDNARWDGVPFLMKAGKVLHNRSAEKRVQFRHVPGNLYNRNFGTDLDQATNELVIRVQPDEAIYLKINNKVPGLGMRLDRSNLNLLYSARYSKEIPDAYERLMP